jgi:pimeloyl-ACP methyl ester carboxylesterase
MPYLDLSDERIYYALHRNTAGRLSVLLIHGAGENHLVWPSGLRRLPETIVYAIDLPGHGKSSGQGRGTIEAYVDWLVAFVDALHLKSVILIGHSMGGAIAQLFALKYPDRVAGLVLIATSAKLRVAPQLLDLVHSNFCAAIELIGQWEWGPSISKKIRQLGQQQLLATDPAVIFDDYQACDTFDLREQLGVIQTPVLIIGGEVDQMIPLEHVEFMAKRLPHARLVMVPAAGHMVMLEAEEQVVNAVIPFVHEAGQVMQ